MTLDKEQSMAQKILAEKESRIEFLTLKVDEKDYFAYIIISESHYPKYQQAIATGKVNPDEHGLVFAYGEGTEAPPEIKNMVNQLLS